MSTGAIHIGTSGWHYKHWIGTFYPATTKTKEQFAIYAENFQTVELNNPFYRMPTFDTFASWYQNSPHGFLFSVKASRYITHMKKLNDSEAALTLLLSNALGLADKLGPILFQLPPEWKINVARMEAFVSSLPQEIRFVFEFRNASWYNDEVFTLLKKYNCAFCLYELDGHHSPTVCTADFTYIRLFARP